LGLLMAWTWNSVCGHFISFKNGRKNLTLLTFGSLLIIFVLFSVQAHGWPTWSMWVTWCAGTMLVTPDVNKTNTLLHNVPLSLLFQKCQPDFKQSSYFCCYISLDLLRYFWRPTGRLAATMQGFATNICVCPWTVWI